MASPEEAGGGGGAWELQDNSFFVSRKYASNSIMWISRQKLVIFFLNFTPN